MKLITADASPFGRKCRFIVHELNLQRRVEIVDPGAITPVAINKDVIQANPLGMIPALVLANGEALFDSRVIAEYLNHSGHGNLFPDSADEKFRSLKLQALADGILDISIALRYETALRPEQLHWPEWIEHQCLAINRGLGALNELCPEFSAQKTIGEITVACALGYRDFRFEEIDWRTDNPALAKWFDAASQWDSMRKTIPA